MAYTLLIVWLFITFMLFLCVFMYAKILTTIDDLIRRKKIKERQREIQQSVDELTNKLQELEYAFYNFGKKRRSK